VTCLFAVFSGSFRAFAAEPPLPARHALFVIVGQYGHGLPTLAGTARDVEHARALAHALSVPEDQIHILRDRDASADAIRRAADDLAMRLAPSDQVLLYFSGLGSHRADLDRPGVCEETFIAGDGTRVGYGELASYFLPVAERAEKTLAVLDSCSSPEEGVAGLAQRCVAPPAEDACSSKRSWRGFVTELRKSAVPTANIVALQAAAPGAPAWGDATHGGLFGFSLSECVRAARGDRDRSGALSVEELSDCAKAGVTRRLAARATPRVQVAGNRYYAPFVTGSAGGASPALLADLHAGRDGRRDVVLSAAGRKLSLRSAAVGYLYLIASEPDGGYRLLFPTADARENRLRAGTTFTWPGKFAAGDAVLAVIADNARDMTQLPDGARFADDAGGRATLMRFVTASLRRKEAPCLQSGRARNLSLARGCSDAYAAGFLILDSN